METNLGPSDMSDEDKQIVFWLKLNVDTFTKMQSN